MCLMRIWYRLDRIVLTSAVLLAASMFLPATALGITVVPSAHDFIGAVDVDLKLASTDPTGTVVLLVDGTAAYSGLAAPGDSISVPALALPPGSHSLSAHVRSRTSTVRSNSVAVRSWASPGTPVLLSPAGYAASGAEASVKVGEGTTSLSLYINGRLVLRREVAPNTVASMGRLELAKGVNVVKLVASNPVASSTSSTKVSRLEFPWPTCIIIDKSERRLYWVRDGQLVKIYPIAIGKPGTPTPVGVWRIGAKYHTSPSSVYGPRKMRLFRKVSGGFAYTAYNIHGTNQEWVIGTMASHGCIRMYNKDVLELFPQVPIGTMVQTRE